MSPSGSWEVKEKVGRDTFAAGIAALAEKLGRPGRAENPMLRRRTPRRSAALNLFGDQADPIGGKEQSTKAA